MKMERCEVANYSTEMFKSFSIITFKYNRTNAAINATLTILKDMNNMKVR